MESNRINPTPALKAVIKEHPKKTVGGFAILAIVLGVIAEGRPFCAMAPPPWSTICTMVTVGASIGAKNLPLDEAKLDSPDGGVVLE